MSMGECVESAAGVKDVQTEVVSIGRNEASLVHCQVTAPTEKGLLALADWPKRVFILKGLA